MSRLLVCGAGGHGKVVAEIAESSGAWDEIMFLDDRYPNLSRVLRFPVVGSLQDRARYFHEGFTDAHIAFGDNALRMRWIETMTAEGFKFPCLVHKAACVSPTAHLGHGSVVMAGAVINASVHIGRGVIINTCSTVDHDCHIGDAVHISPGSNLAGDVKVEKLAWLGIGSVVLQGVRVGNNAVVGAGAVVLQDIGAGTRVVGNPARKLVDKNE